MAKEKKTSVDVQVNGKVPVNNLLTAEVPVNAIINGRIALNHRQSALVYTGIKVELPENHVLCFQLVPSLSQKGMIATNGPGRISNGPVSVHLLNCGREIVEIKNGDPLVEVWIEERKPIEIKWLENKG